MGERLQELRRAAGLSQPGLAQAAGVPVGTLRNWEQGRRVPLLDTAAAVARALGVTLDDLAGTPAGPVKFPKRHRPPKGD
jgi:transcriptional regulator with XRE-family HTH domain